MKMGNTLKTLQVFQEHKKTVRKQKVSTVQPQRFVSVIQNCDLLGAELPNVLKACKTLDELEAQISGHVNKRSDTKVDAELRKKVKMMAAAEGEPFADAYGKISAYSKVVASGSLSYQERPM